MAQMKPRYFVNSFATVTGANTYTQRALHADFDARLAKLPGSETLREKTQKLYENSNVDTRHLEFSIEEIDRRRESSVWHPIVRDSIISLASRALERVMVRGIAPADCDALITVSAVFDGIPGLSTRIAETSGFRQDTLLFDLGTLACGGANHGINQAHLLLETGKCKTVAVICADALNTHAQARRFKALPELSEVVARVVPSDTASALVISRERGVEPILSYSSCDLAMRSWRGGLNYSVAGTADDGEPATSLDKGLRTRIAAEAAVTLVPEVLRNPLCVHPGGTALIRELAKSEPLLLPAGEYSAAVLKANGNVGGSSVLFVLARMLELGARIDPTLRFLAFLPGAITSLLTLQDVERG